MLSGTMAAPTIITDFPGRAAACIRFLRRHAVILCPGGGTPSDQEWLRSDAYCRKVDVPT